jgi:hypothetical protein
MNKSAILNGGRMWAESGTGTQNTFSGPVAIGVAGGTVDASSGAVLAVSGNVSGVGALTKKRRRSGHAQRSEHLHRRDQRQRRHARAHPSFTTGATVTIASGSTAQLASSALTPNNVILRAPTISAAGKLDLRDNKAVFTNMPLGTFNGTSYTGVSALVAGGNSGGAWDGNGIVTTMPDAQSGLTSLGVATAAQAGYAGSNFAGVSVNATDVLVMYTYAGDANLDGFISGDDYSAVDFNLLVPNSSGWFNGDFNWDGAVTGDDYSAIDFNILAQGAPFPTGASIGAVTAVPGRTSFLLAPLVALLSRRPRKRRVRPT